MKKNNPEPTSKDSPKDVVQYHICQEILMNLLRLDRGDGYVGPLYDWAKINGLKPVQVYSSIQNLAKRGIITLAQMDLGLQLELSEKTLRLIKTYHEN